MTAILAEAFAGPRLDPRLQWFCEPTHWSLDMAARQLRIEPTERTDFWQQTHYGFRADNGHFLFLPVAGDFVLTTHVVFHPRHQYDQAGLMIRLSVNCWLKTSVEYEPEGPSRLGAVVTNNGYSDWSTQEFPAERREVELRIRRQQSDYLVQAAVPGGAWSQIRLARLLEDDGVGPVSAGLYACSPQGAGFIAEFRRLSIEGGD